jgi:uncharacterized protein YjeT (DUF2065 family)
VVGVARRHRARRGGLLPLAARPARPPPRPADPAGAAGGLPLLGLGLWRSPEATIAAELALVLGGSYLYWRAAARAARAARGASEGRARLLGGLVLAAGLLTLAVDVAAG